MKKQKVYLPVALVVLCLGFAIAAVMMVRHTSADTSCKPSNNAHSYQVMIMDSKVDNADIQARVCDTITFMNMDHQAREIAFGAHDNHTAYDGVAEKVLNDGQSFTITLDQPGSFHWHDHLEDEVEGYFTVK